MPSGGSGSGSGSGSKQGSWRRQTVPAPSRAPAPRGDGSSRTQSRGNSNRTTYQRRSRGWLTERAGSQGQRAAAQPQRSPNNSKRSNNTWQPSRGRRGHSSSHPNASSGSDSRQPSTPTKASHSPSSAAKPRRFPQSDRRDDRGTWNNILRQVQQMMRDRSDSKRLDGMLDELVELHYPNHALSSNDCDSMVFSLGNLMRTITDSDLMNSKVCVVVQNICLKQKALLKPKTLKVIVKILLSFVNNGATFFEHEGLKTLGAVLLDHADACMSMKKDILAVLLQRTHPANAIVRSRMEAVTALYYFCIRGAKKLKADHQRIFEVLLASIRFSSSQVGCAAVGEDPTSDLHHLQILNSSLGASNHIVQFGEIAKAPAFARGLTQLMTAVDAAMSHVAGASSNEPEAGQVVSGGESSTTTQIAAEDNEDADDGIDSDDESDDDDDDDDANSLIPSASPEQLRRSVRCQILFLIENISKRARSFSADHWSVLLRQRHTSRKHAPAVPRLPGENSNAASWRRTTPATTEVGSKPNGVRGDAKKTSHLFLNDIFLSDPSPKVRAAALTAAASVIAAAPLPFWISEQTKGAAEAKKDRTQRKDPNRDKAVRALAVVHGNFLHLFRREKSMRVLLQLVKCCALVIQHVPYAHFNDKLLLDLMLAHEVILFGHRMDRRKDVSAQFRAPLIVVSGSALPQAKPTAVEQTQDDEVKNIRLARGPTAAAPPKAMDQRARSTKTTVTSRDHGKCYPANLVAAALSTWNMAFSCQTESLRPEVFLAVPLVENQRSIPESSEKLAPAPFAAFSFPRTIPVEEYPTILKVHIENSRPQQQQGQPAPPQQPQKLAQQRSDSKIASRGGGSKSVGQAPSKNAPSTRLHALIELLPASSILLSTISMHCPQAVWPQWSTSLKPRVLKMFRGEEDERHASLLIVANLVKGIHAQSESTSNASDAVDPGARRDQALLACIPDWPEFVEKHLLRSCQDASVKVRVCGMECLCLFGDGIWSRFDVSAPVDTQASSRPRGNTRGPPVAELVDNLRKGASTSTATVVTAVCKLFGSLAACRCIRSTPWFGTKVTPFLLSCVSDSRSKTIVTVKACWAVSNLCVSPPSITTVFADPAPPSQGQRPHAFLRRVADALCDACTRSDKIVGAAMRGIGLLGEQICDIHTVDRACVTQLIDVMTACLVQKNTAATKSNKKISNEAAKLIWNVCSSAERVLRNLHTTDASLASDNLINGLLKTLSTHQNFKIRINATLALAAPQDRAVFGTVFPTVWGLLLQHVTENFVKPKQSAADGSSVPTKSLAIAAEGFSLSEAAAAHVETSQLSKYQLLLDAAVDTLARKLVRVTSATADEFAAIGEDLVRKHEAHFAAFIAHKVSICATTCTQPNNASAESAPGSVADHEMWEEWKRTQHKFQQLRQAWGLQPTGKPAAGQLAAHAAPTMALHDATSNGDDDDDSSDGEL